MGIEISSEVSVQLNASDSPSTLITSSFSTAVSESKFLSSVWIRAQHSCQYYQPAPRVLGHPLTSVCFLHAIDIHHRNNHLLRPIEIEFLNSISLPYHPLLSPFPRHIRLNDTPSIINVRPHLEESEMSSSFEFRAREGYDGNWVVESETDLTDPSNWDFVLNLKFSLYPRCWNVPSTRLWLFERVVDENYWDWIWLFHKLWIEERNGMGCSTWEVKEVDRQGWQQHIDRSKSLAFSSITIGIKTDSAHALSTNYFWTKNCILLDWNVR